MNSDTSWKYVSYLVIHLLGQGSRDRPGLGPDARPQAWGLGPGWGRAQAHRPWSGNLAVIGGYLAVTLRLLGRLLVAGIYLAVMRQLHGGYVTVTC